MKARRPNFFIVGAPKCGTTAMDFYLAQHPDIFMARKECHHFATDFMPEDDPDTQRERYLALFAEASSETMLGESSVFYLYSKAAARNIYDFNPDAKIIVQLRNPVDVLISHHSQVIFNGEEDLTDLREAMAAEKDRREGRRIPCKMQFLDRLYYSELFNFPEQLDRYFSVFGRDQVHVVIFEDFKSDTTGEYHRTLEFLGVDTDVTVDFKVVNANKTIRSPLLRSLLREPPAPISTAFRLFFPLNTREAIKQFLKKANTRYEPRKPIDIEFRNLLTRKYANDVERLSVLLDRDLTSWNDIGAVEIE